MSGPKSQNIVFAYSNIQSENCRGLQIEILQKRATWQRIAHFSFPNEYLWGQNGRTIGLQTLPLGNNGQDALLVISSEGAALGATAQVLQWNSRLNRFINLMANDAEGSGFKVSPQMIKVFLNKQGRLSGPSITYAFEGSRYQKISHP